MELDSRSHQPRKPESVIGSRLSARELLAVLSHVGRRMRELEREHCAELAVVDPEHRLGARNLLHYVALRQHDLTDLQPRLAALGLSSIGASEPDAALHVRRVCRLLALMSGARPTEEALSGLLDELARPRGAAELSRKSAACFGPAAFPGHSHTMVTLPATAAVDASIIAELAEAGMSVARINASHGYRAQWEAMVENLRRVEERLGRRIRIYVDLPGPKLRVAPLPEQITKRGRRRPGRLKLHAGRLLLMRFTTRDLLTTVARPGETGADNPPLVPEIVVPVPELDAALEVGHRVFFDDGKIAARVEGREPGAALLRIVSPQGSTATLRGGKGVNVPDTELELPALSEADHEALSFAIAEADLLGYSFVSRPEQVEQLQRELRTRRGQHLALVLKIETRRALEQLPALLLQAMRSPRVAVMIARGDLAVELGALDIAEAQEQILWLCEAAHVPVIWATQILEGLAKRGLASRAELSDAVLSVRAECVMLNKGPHIVEALSLLAKIDERMAGHQDKKRNALRPLAIARRFAEPKDPALKATPPPGEHLATAM